MRFGENATHLNAFRSVQSCDHCGLSRNASLPLTMASSSPTDICPTCLKNFQDVDVDERVLPCLHSVCKACIDRMAVEATDGLVKCPICRATARLPPTGAAGLPKDVSASTRHTSDGCVSLECGMCDDDKTSKKPTMWCKRCRLPLCEHHVGSHIVNASSHGDVHLVVPLSMASQENGGEGKDSATPMFAHHGEAVTAVLLIWPSVVTAS